MIMSTGQYATCHYCGQSYLEGDSRTIPPNCGRIECLEAAAQVQKLRRMGDQESEQEERDD